MAKRSTDEPLLPGSEQEIRRLRFVHPALEQAFREDYARRSLPQLRLVFWFTLFAQIPLSVVSVVLYDWSVTEGRFWARAVSGCAWTATTNLRRHSMQG